MIEYRNRSTGRRIEREQPDPYFDALPAHWERHGAPVGQQDGDEGAGDQRDEGAVELDEHELDEHVGDHSGDVPVGDTAARPEKPARTAARALWADYVRRLGHDPGEATKAELIELYG